MKYFIVCYVANSDRGQAVGTIDAWTEEAYLNHNNVKEIIRQINKGLNLRNIAITSIIQLTAKEYKCWSKAEKIELKTKTNGLHNIKNDPKVKEDNTD